MIVPTKLGCFFLAGLFEPSLTFACEAGAYRTLEHLHGTNTLAYRAHSNGTKKFKCFKFGLRKLYHLGHFLKTLKVCLHF